MTTATVDHLANQMMEMEGNNISGVPRLEAPLAVYHQATVVPAAPAAPQNQWPEARMELLKRTYAAGSTNDEFLLFIETCKRLDLSPEARQIFSVSRWDTMQGCMVRQTQVSIDGLRLIAERTGQYRGQTPIEWCGKDGVWKEIWTEDGPPFAARVGVYREGFAAPLYRTAKYSAFVQTKKGGGPNAMWATKGDHMLGKCAEANALRAAFPNETSGVYTVDEMGQANNDAPEPRVERIKLPPQEMPPRALAHEAAAPASAPDFSGRVDHAPTVNFPGHPMHGKPASLIRDKNMVKFVRALQRTNADAAYLKSVIDYAATRGITDFSDKADRRTDELAAAIGGESSGPPDEDWLHTCAWPDAELHGDITSPDIRKWNNAERLLEYGQWIEKSQLADKQARIERVEACLRRLVDEEAARADEALARQAQLAAEAG